MAHAGQDLGDQLLGGAVGQGAEHQVRAVGLGGLGGAEAQARVGAGQGWVQIGHGRPLVGAGGDCDHFEVRVAGQQPQQLGAGVARGAQDGDGPLFGHDRPTIHACA